MCYPRGGDTCLCLLQAGPSKMVFSVCFSITHSRYRLASIASWSRIWRQEVKASPWPLARNMKKISRPSRNFVLMFNYWNTFARETEIPRLTEGSTYFFKATHCREHFLPIIPALHGFPVGVQVLMQIYKIPHSLASEISGTFCRQRCIHTTPAMPPSLAG